MFEIIGRDPIITVKPRDPEMESLDVYWSKQFSEFLIFKICEDVVVGECCKTFKGMYEYVTEAVDESGENDNLIFHHPTT